MFVIDPLEPGVLFRLMQKAYERAINTISDHIGLMNLNTDADAPETIGDRLPEILPPFLWHGGVALLARRTVSGEALLLQNPLHPENDGSRR